MCRHVWGIVVLAFVFAAQAKDPPRLDLHGDSLPSGAIARVGTVRLRHGGGVTALAFSADGKSLASAGEDNTLSVWDAETGKELQRFQSEAVGSEKFNYLVFAPARIAFSSDRKVLLSYARYQPVRRWHL